MKRHDWRTVAAVLVAAMALGACGGGDDEIFGGDDDGNGPVAGDPGGGDNGDGGGGGLDGDGIPASALESSTALVEYVRNLIAGDHDQAEPIPIGENVSLPTDDQSEAVALR